MANRRKEIPSFVSIEVGVARSIAEAMTDDEWGKWSKKALDDLSIGCTRKDTDVRVRNLYEKSKENMDKEYLRKKEWYENRKAQGNQLTADGDTREDSKNMTNDGRNAVELESRTSANLYEGAANGNNADCDHTHECAHTDSATAFESLGSGKPKTQAQNDQRRTGGFSPLSSPHSPPVRSGAVDVLNLAYAGEFGNVRLTQEQYAQLGIKFGNQQKLNRAIDSLSCQIENGEKNPANHYAELVKWASYRDDMEEKEELRASGAPHYETVSEHNARVLAAGKKWIDEHFPKKDNKHG